MDIILKYFKNLSALQVQQLYTLHLLYMNLHSNNERFNARKDINTFYIKEVLYAYSIARYIDFKAGTRVLDVGSGPGFPCIPLAVLFPQIQFTMCDYANNIQIAKEVSDFLELKNTVIYQGKVQELQEKYHFVSARAVAYPEEIYLWTKHMLSEDNFNDKPNGYLLFKDDYLKKEIRQLQNLDSEIIVEEIELSRLYDENFFDRQKMIYFYQKSLNNLAIKQDKVA